MAYPRGIKYRRPSRPETGENRTHKPHVPSDLIKPDLNEEPDLVDLAQDLVGSVLGYADAEKFVEQYANGQFAEITETLKLCLATRTAEGFLTGRQGSPTERYAAEEILKRLAELQPQENQR